MTVGPTTTAFAWIVGRVLPARHRLRRLPLTPEQRLALARPRRRVHRQGLAAVAAPYRAPVVAGPEGLSLLALVAA
jgi:hypothetical protein